MRHDWTPPERLTGSKGANRKAFFSILLPYFWPSGVANKVAALACFLALGASKACNVVAPLFIATATDALFSSDWPRVASSIVAFGLLRLGVSVFEEAQRLVYLRVKEVAYHEVASRTFAHLHALSLHWHISKRSGVVLRAMDRGISSANTVVEMLVLRLVPTVIEMIVLAAIFGTTYRSPGSAGVLAGTFVLYFIITFAITEYRTSIRLTVTRADNEANQIAVDTLTGFETVKAFNNEQYELGRYSAAVKKYQRATRQNQASLVCLNISQATVMRASLIGVLLVSARDVMDGRMSIGEFVAVQAYVTQLFAPLSYLGSIYTMIQNAYTDMQNLGDLLQEKADVVDKPKAPPLQLRDRAHGATVEFRDVVFAYPAGRDNRIEAQMRDAQRLEALAPVWYKPWTWCKACRKDAVPITSPSASKPPVSAAAPDDVAVTVNAAGPNVEVLPVLRGISFTIRAGTTTAIVGATGAGKSTISKLLFRFYDVTSGSILIDGQDIRDVSQTSMRDAIGVVPQDTMLFNDTIRCVPQHRYLRSKEPAFATVLAIGSCRFNIKYGRPTATDEEMKEAAASAQIGHFIETQKDGYDTRVGERGLRLSGGEKQRVAIARMLLKDPPILILDEATSSLDTLTEAQVQAAINNVRQGRTVLCIAHRLSTVKDADEIIVLDAGVVVERGTHAELLATQGRYYNLWHQQITDSLASSVDGAAAASVDPAAVSAAPQKPPSEQPPAAAAGPHAHNGQHAH